MKREDLYPTDEEIIDCFIESNVLDRIIAHNYLPEGRAAVKLGADNAVKKIDWELRMMQVVDEELTVEHLGNAEYRRMIRSRLRELRKTLQP